MHPILLKTQKSFPNPFANSNSFFNCTTLLFAFILTQPKNAQQEKVSSRISHRIKVTKNLKNLLNIRQEGMYTNTRKFVKINKLKIFWISEAEKMKANALFLHHSSDSDSNTHRIHKQS